MRPSLPPSLRFLAGSLPTVALLLALPLASCGGGGGSGGSSDSPAAGELSLEVQGPDGPLVLQGDLYLLEVELGDSLALEVLASHSLGAGQSLGIEVLAGDPAALGLSDGFPILVGPGSVAPSIQLGQGDVALAPGSCVLALLAAVDGAEDDGLARGLELRVLPPEPPPPGDPVGQWNFFREGTACGADEFADLPMLIDERPDGDFDVLLGESGASFAFVATRGQGEQLLVSGTDSVGDTTLAIQQAVWTLSADENRLSGTMTVERTEAGTTCTVVDQIDAWRVDGTDASPARGTWEIVTTTQTDACNSQADEIEDLTFELLPRREDAFTLLVETPNGSSFQFDAQLDAGTIALSGSDSADGETASLLAGSSLVFTESSQRLDGTILVSIEDGGTSCTQELAVRGLRPTTGGAWLPYLEDFLGQQRLVGIDRDDPGQTTVLVDGMGVQLILQSEFGSTYACTVPELVVDPVAGTIVEEGPALMFYSSAQGVWSLDLRHRADADGQLVQSEPELVLPGDEQVYLDAYPCSGDYVAVLKTLFGSIHEIRRDGEVVTTPAFGQRAILSDPTTGDYRGVVTNAAGTSDLTHIFEGESTLIRTGVENWVIGPDGTILLTSGTEVLAWDPVGGLSTVHGTGLFFPLDVGSTMFLYASSTTANPSSVRIHRWSPGSTPSLLLTLNDVWVPSTSGNPFFGPFTLLALEDEYVVVNYFSSAGAWRTVSVDSLGSQFQELGAWNFDLSIANVATLGTQLTANGPGTTALWRDLASPGGVSFSGSRWVGRQPRTTYPIGGTTPIGASRENVGLYLVRSSTVPGGALEHVDRFSISTSNLRRLMNAEGSLSFSISHYGEDLVVRKDLGPDSDIFHARWQETDSGLRITNSPGEEDTNID